jgi:hypothetical protein
MQPPLRVRAQPAPQLLPAPAETPTAGSIIKVTQLSLLSVEIAGLAGPKRITYVKIFTLIRSEFVWQVISQRTFLQICRALADAGPPDLGE